MCETTVVSIYVPLNGEAEKRRDSRQAARARSSKRRLRETLRLVATLLVRIFRTSPCWPRTPSSGWISDISGKLSARTCFADSLRRGEGDRWRHRIPFGTVVDGASASPLRGALAPSTPLARAARAPPRPRGAGAPSAARRGRPLGRAARARAGRAARAAPPLRRPRGRNRCIRRNVAGSVRFVVTPISAACQRVVGA